MLSTGLLRGVNPDLKCFYLTTPEPDHVLRRTNVLAMGSSLHPEDIVSQVHCSTCVAVGVCVCV